MGGVVFIVIYLRGFPLPLSLANVSGRFVIRQVSLSETLAKEVGSATRQNAPKINHDNIFDH